MSDNAELARAYRHCVRVARAHYENFPVASWLLPAAMRPHIAAIYAFARRADDFADDPGRPAPERLRLLHDWQARLHRAACPDPVERRSGPHTGDDYAFLALGHTIQTHRLPVALFDDLLSAFSQDVTTARYPTWIDLLDYCRRSANPVGRLVLRVAGYENARLDAASDAVCTGLQLTNFWQDAARDFSTGRLYVPLEDCERFGAREDDLRAGNITAEWRLLLREMTRRTRELFLAGRAVCDGVPGRLRWELRFTWLGGMRILDKLERNRFDVFHRRPQLGMTDVPVLLRNAMFWTTAGVER